MPPVNEDQAELVRRAREGDGDSFGRLLEIHASRAFGAAYAILSNREDAEDAVQDAALQAYRSIKHLKSDSSFDTWFIRIVVTKAIDRLRRNVRRPTSELSEADTPSIKLVQAQDWSLEVDEAVSHLPRQHQAIVRLHFLAGHSTSEVAQLVGEPEGTVRRKLSESYRSLRLFFREAKDETQTPR